MSSVIYIPQVQIISGQWIDVGIPASSFKEADIQSILFPLTNKLIAFRVIQSSYDDAMRDGRVSLRNCHGCGTSG